MGISTMFEHTLTEQCTYAETAISELLVQILIIAIRLCDSDFLKESVNLASDNVFKSFFYNLHIVNVTYFYFRSIWPNGCERVSHCDNFYQVWSRSTYPLLIYDVFIADTLRHCVTLTFEPLTLNVRIILAVMWSNFVPNFSKIKQ